MGELPVVPMLSDTHDSSTHFPAILMKLPDTGMYTAISAIELLTVAKREQYMAYAMNRLPGPPEVKPPPILTKSAVPIEPPTAISWI